MPTIEITYTGELRTNSVHLKSNNTIITDAPVDNQGKGETFSPTDLLTSSLGSCMLTIMGIRANKLGIDLSGTFISLTKHMSSNPRMVQRIEAVVSFPGIELSNNSKEILENAAKTCPVAESLSKDLVQDISFKY